MTFDQYPLYAAIYALNVDTLPRLAKFPREYRRMLAEKIAWYQQELMEMCIEAIVAPKHRLALLQKCNIRLEWLRVLWRTSRDVGAASFSSYGSVIIKLDSIGKMVGGWLNKLSGSNQSHEVFS